MGLLGAGPLLAARAAASLPRGPRPYSFSHENVLGTSLDLKFAATGWTRAEAAEEAALAEIERLRCVLSSFDEQSEFRRWMAGGSTPKHVSSDLFRVLSLFSDWRERTGGALNAAAETASLVWKQAAASGRLPSEEELASAAASAARLHWALDSESGTAARLTGDPLALHSFAKSYIAERAAQAALHAGASGVVVNIGGDLVVRGDWSEPVAIANPFDDAENAEPLARLRIARQAVATSGNYRRGVEIAGRHYSHIVDPRTGKPAGHIVSSTAVAADATEAGALATAFSVLSIEESRRLAASRRGVEYLLVERNGNLVRSPGWNRLTTAMAPAAAQGGAAGWDASMELLIQIELARIEGQRYRRPFLAVWIEDKDRFPVRTVALWFDKPRWLPDLKAWSRADRMRNMAEGTDLTGSVSSATRPPGKYALKWDGKDNQGKYVKPGAYTVFIEAAREHGTYQLLHQEMEFSGKPRQVQLTGNVEIAAASLDYRKSAR